MTISRRKLPGFTDQPQQTAVTILKRRTTFHIGSGRGTADQWCWAGYGFQADACSHIHCSMVTFLHRRQLNYCWRDWAETAPHQWNQKSNLATHVMIDFMSTIRLTALGNFPNMGAAIFAIITSASCLSTCPISLFLYLTPTSRCH